MANIDIGKLVTENAAKLVQMQSAEVKNFFAQAGLQGGQLTEALIAFTALIKGKQEENALTKHNIAPGVKNRGDNDLSGAGGKTFGANGQKSFVAAYNQGQTGKNVHQGGYVNPEEQQEGKGGILPTGDLKKLAMQKRAPIDFANNKNWVTAK